MVMNTGTFEERLAAGKAFEARIMEELQRSFWSVIPATEAQDKADKIDCWVRWKGVSYSVAIKWRDSGVDLGIAAVRPFSSLGTFRSQMASGSVPYDRDAQHYADLYAVGTPDGVSVYTGDSVRRAVADALEQFAEIGAIKSNQFEVKVVEDRGATGYTSGQYKLIVYIKLNSLERVDI